jgi:hypothetical protein
MLTGVVNHGQRFEKVATRLGESIVDIDEPPPGMGQAMRQDRLQLARQVAREGIAHLDRRKLEGNGSFKIGHDHVKSS